MVFFKSPSSKKISFRHSRAGKSPVEYASAHRMLLDSRLRGNDEIMNKNTGLFLHFNS